MMAKSKFLIFITILVLMLFCAVSPGNAEITVEHDEFEKTTTYISRFQGIGPWAGLFLLAKKGTTAVVLQVMLAYTPLADTAKTLSSIYGDDWKKGKASETLKEEWIQQDYYRIADRDAKMKINKEIVELPCGWTKTEIETFLFIGGAAYKLSESIVAQLKNAENMTIRIYLEEGPDIT